MGERGSRRSAAPPRRTHQAHAPGQHQQPGHRHAGTETLRGDEIETTFSHSGPQRHRHRHRHRSRPRRPVTRTRLRCASAHSERRPRPSAAALRRSAMAAAPPRSAAPGRRAFLYVPHGNGVSLPLRVETAQKSRSERKRNVHGLSFSLCIARPPHRRRSASVSARRLSEHSANRRPGWKRNRATSVTPHVAPMRSSSLTRSSANVSVQQFPTYLAGYISASRNSASKLQSRS